MEIGSQTATYDFRARHKRFFDGSAVLERAISLAFSRAFDVSDVTGTVIFFLGSRCSDDFREILLLAANGYGWGATAHLRGMFERCVTAAHLHEHPDQSRDFVDYDVIQRWKLIQELSSAFDVGEEQRASMEELKAAADAVRERFMISTCKKCETTRLNHTWTKLSLVDMARQVKGMSKMGSLLGPGYYVPLGQAHSTLASIVQRTSQIGEHLFAVDQGLARDEADRTFHIAHLLLLNALVIQHAHFALKELETPIEEGFAHFRTVWEDIAPSER